MKRIYSIVFAVFLLCPVFLRAQEKPKMPQTPKNVQIEQIPAKPDETRGLYEVGTKPYEWLHHGQKPYFKIWDREDLKKMSELPNLIDDLMAVYTEAQAKRIKEKLAQADDTTQIVEVNLVNSTTMKTMIFQGDDPKSAKREERIKVENMVVNTGVSEPAYQIILEPEYGSLVIWIPKVCGNICQNPFPAQVQTSTIRTEVQVVETEKPVYVSGLEPGKSEVTTSVTNETKKYETNTNKAVNKPSGNKKWIVAGVAAAIVGTGIYLASRGKNETQPLKNYPGGGVISPSSVRVVFTVRF